MYLATSVLIHCIRTSPSSHSISVCTCVHVGVYVYVWCVYVWERELYIIPPPPFPLPHSYLPLQSLMALLTWTWGQRTSDLLYMSSDSKDWCQNMWRPGHCSTQRGMLCRYITCGHLLYMCVCTVSCTKLNLL